uniref:Uncharacterized protein n=1 Tax=Anguilla anguilla TaxID=7936 RepID=A0A0E9QJB5_ANGAN
MFIFILISFIKLTKKSYF